MNFGQDYYDLYGKQVSADSKVPFYMTYPMRNSFFEEAEYERDCRKLQEMYPRDAKRVQELVENECDKMEYEGSMMFDEYPDRLSIRLICGRICRELQKDEEPEGTVGRDHPLSQLVEVMMMQEMYRRRCRYRRCRRWY